MEIERDLLDYCEPSKVNQQNNLVDTASFRAHRETDYSHQEKQNRSIGLKVELLVLKFERERLKNIGLGDLADKVIHASKSLSYAQNYGCGCFGFQK